MKMLSISFSSTGNAVVNKNQALRKTMNHALTILLLSFLLPFSTAYSQNDKENCKDHPLIPTRIPNYFIGSCDQNEFSSHVVLTAKGEKTIEGKKPFLNTF